jgi:dihydroorotate dehydrogenase
MLYKHIAKPLLFKLDPEDVHDRATVMGKLIGSNPVTRGALALSLRYEHPALVQTIKGITFPNPIGLAAGFDKNCELMQTMAAVGFGFEEVGSVTNLPYKGNPKPRLTRLPEDQSILVYYGLKNLGADALRKRLTDKHDRPRKFDIPIGVSIAKTNIEFPDLDAKIDDWARAVEKLQDCGDYLTINVSCPNTFDPQDYNEPCVLEPLLRHLAEIINVRKPIFLKLSADMPFEQFDAIVRLCDAIARRKADNARMIDGFILTNLVKKRENLELKTDSSRWASRKGGFSGKVVAKKALELTRHAYKTAGDRYIIISCGGVFTAEDAYERIRVGASLVQLVTGLIYGGPATIKQINKGLVRLLRRDGFDNVAAAVGCENAQADQIDL